jgi:hypothetical protein
MNSKILVTSFSVKYFLTFLSCPTKWVNSYPKTINVAHCFKTKCDVNKGNAKRGVSPRLKIRPCDLDRWPWKSIGFKTLLRNKYVPSLVKINWRILILECSQGCYAVKVWPDDLDLWPWKSIGFQTLLSTKYVPSVVKIHWRMLILECSQGCYTVKIWPVDLDLWPMTLKINRVPDSLKD